MSYYCNKRGLHANKINLMKKLFLKKNKNFVRGLCRSEPIKIDFEFASGHTTARRNEAERKSGMKVTL